MAAPVWASSNKGGGTTATLAIPVPSGIAVGDLLSAWLHSDTTTTAATFTASGWTATFAAITANPGAAGNSAQHFWKIADSADAAASTFSFSRSGGSGQWGAIIDRLTGADGSGPVDVFATATYNSANDGFCPSVTTTGADRLVLHYTTWDEGKTFVSVPAGDTLSTNNILSSNAAGSAYRTFAAAGATGIAQWDLSSGTRTSNATVAFKAAAGGGSVASAAGSSSGAASTSGAASARSAAVASASAFAVANAFGAAVSASTGSAAGTALGTAATQVIFEAAGSSQGSASVSGKGLAVSQAVGSASGAAAATGSASAPSVKESTGVSAGISTTVGSSQAIVQAPGTAAGTSTMQANGLAVASASGEAAGSSQPVGAAQAIAQAQGESYGSAAAAGVVTVIVTGAGQAYGFATVVGWSLDGEVSFPTDYDRIIVVDWSGRTIVVEAANRTIDSSIGSSIITAGK